MRSGLEKGAKLDALTVQSHDERVRSAPATGVTVKPAEKNTDSAVGDTSRQTRRGEEPIHESLRLNGKPVCCQDVQTRYPSADLPRLHGASVVSGTEAEVLRFGNTALQIDHVSHSRPARIDQETEKS